MATLDDYPPPEKQHTQLKHDCLYPGATFQGIQKTGRNSYEVKVTIKDVDFSSSFLCGYLRISGLTHDLPELTTYFDAEIIGNRYGFLTQNWDATEQEDLVHWSRFPAFRHVKHELQRPHLTMCDKDRGALFMRWKERFLVPEDQVQDIKGASFAGFYYICVDFDPSNSKLPEHEPTSLTPEDTKADSTAPPSVEARPNITPVATISGFYYHRNSEPYQQLFLSHVPCTSSGLPGDPNMIERSVQSPSSTRL
ncbi:hypothetical protein L218DRAFT_915443 [Marasmius fiardii PR-910]|nr:hypothetical protein L218DRAFT_915443 [Marasmius fiardii PR-910]